MNILKDITSRRFLTAPGFALFSRASSCQVLCRPFSTETDSTRPVRPLMRNQSINSSFSLDHPVDGAPNESEFEDNKLRRNLSRSLVGTNVHDSYSAKRDKDRWRKRPLFSRQGFQASFQTGHDAAELLIAEATRRDPHQVAFLSAISSCVRDLSPAIERTPKLAWIFKQLMEPEEFVSFRVGWKDDAYNTRVNRGYVVVYSRSLSVKTKGGIAMCSIEPYATSATTQSTTSGPSETSFLDRRMGHGLVRMRGWEQTLRNALCSKPEVSAVGFGDIEFEKVRSKVREKKEQQSQENERFVGFGGQFIGTDFDPHGKSDTEVKRFCDSLMRILYSILTKDSNNEILASFETDLNVGKKEMNFLRDAFLRLYENDPVNIARGTNTEISEFPGQFGSSCVYPEVRGLSCVHFASRALQVHTDLKSLANQKCLISGSGVLSRSICIKLQEIGAKPICVSDESGVLVAKPGEILTPDLLQLVAHFKVNNAPLSDIPRHALKTATFLPGLRPVDLPAEYAQSASVLFECVACGEVGRFTEADADKCIANGLTAVFECADGMCEDAAIDKLMAHGILFGPAKAVNCGSVVASMYVNELETDEYPSLEEIDNHLKERVIEIHDAVAEVAEKYKLQGNLKAGANLLSFLRIAERELLIK